MIDVRIGDCRQLIHSLADESVDVVMTSPPYWGLRDYGHPDQIGLEATPEEYLKTMLGFFDDVKLKLKAEGNCFVNLGDTYGGASGGYYEHEGELGASKAYIKKKGIGMPKCLCMIPQRFAWGMIERGWILRNEIIWYKPNHMPESVTDRLTKAHEVIYHFVKQQKYYYNLDAIRDAPITQDHREYGIIRGKTRNYNSKFGNNIAFYGGKFEGNKEAESFGSPRARTQREKHSDNQCRTTSCLHDGRNPLDVHHSNGKNPGDVWSITTQPYPESHFAVFPLELVRRPILAGCPVGGTVLDPFGGSGTVGEFCRHNDRNAILFELNPEYIKLIEERTMKKTPELSEYLN